VHKYRRLSKDTKSNFGRTHWMLLIVLMAFGYLANGSAYDALNTYVYLFHKQFGWSTSKLLTYSTYAGWASIIFIVFFTQLARKIGARKCAIIVLSIEAISMFCWGRITSQKMYFIVIMMLVASAGAIMVIRNTIVNNWFPTKPGLSLGWVTLGTKFATASILWLIALGGTLFGFHGNFDIIAAGFVVLLIIALIWLRDNPEEKGCFPDNDRTISAEYAEKLHEEGMRYQKTSPWTVGKLLKTKQVWQIGIGVGGLNLFIASSLVSQMVPAVMTHGFDRSEAMLMMTAMAVISMPFSYICGVIDARIGTKPFLIIFFSWAVILLIFMAMPGRLTAYVSIVMMGIYTGGAGNTLGAITTTVFGRYDYASAYAVIYPMSITLRSCAFAFIGIVSEMTGGYSVPYLILAGVAVFGVINAVTLDDHMIGRSNMPNENESGNQNE